MKYQLAIKGEIDRWRVFAKQLYDVFWSKNASDEEW